VYVTDWLDTPKPPPEWGNRYQLSNSYTVQPEDWGVERRVNMTAPRVASGRVRGEGNFFSRRKVAPEPEPVSKPSRRTGTYVSHSPIAEVAEKIPTEEGHIVTARNHEGKEIQATTKNEYGEIIPVWKKDSLGRTIFQTVEGKRLPVPQPAAIRLANYPETSGLRLTGETMEVVDEPAERSPKISSRRRGSMYPVRSSPIFNIVGEDVIREMTSADLVAKKRVLDDLIRDVVASNPPGSSLFSNNDFKILHPQRRLVQDELGYRGL
jgi:hypothetical protein